jgi:hypothetical protein
MEYLLVPYKRLWTWASSRPSTAARVGSYSVFALAILATISILVFIGGLMALGAACSAIFS